MVDWRAAISSRSSPWGQHQQQSLYDRLLITVGRIIKYLFVNKYSGGRGYDGSTIFYDEILEFDPISGEWNLVDRMIHAREGHAVSVINFSEVAGICY